MIKLTRPLSVGSMLIGKWYMADRMAHRMDSSETVVSLSRCMILRCREPL